MGSIFEDWIPRIHLLQIERETRLAAQVRGESVVAFFDFPDAVRVPCEQYLLYFAQFLKDLGLEARTELQHEAGRVMFSVIPTSENEALDRIREALAVYLQLPDGANLNSSPAFIPEIHVQQLAANIQHLRGQLILAQAIIQQKDLSIQHLQATVNLQSMTITPDVVQTSLQMVETAGKSNHAEDEKLLSGMLTITKFKGKGYEIDLPEMYRRLKERFSKKTSNP